MMFKRKKSRGDQRILVEGSLTEPRLFLENTSLLSAKSDIYKILSANPDQAVGILQAIRSGAIDGAKYEGDCACLVGTIARLQGRDYLDLDPDSFRPAEKWFSVIECGNTPGNNRISAITERWVSEWISENGADQ